MSTQAPSALERLATRAGADVGGLLQIGTGPGGTTTSLNASLRPRHHVLVLQGDDGDADLERLAGSIQVVGRPGADHEERLGAGLAALGDEPLDLVVDDGTHLYPQARAAFERCFPRLAPGGRYVLVGWSWAHAAQVPGAGLDDRPALTNLVVELLMVAGTDPGVVRELAVDQDLVEVVRGDRPLTASFRLAAAYRNRGIRFRPLL